MIIVHNPKKNTTRQKNWGIVVFRGEYFWNHVKSKRKGRNVLTSLEVNGKNITDDFYMAESMNQFFSFVFIPENTDNFPEFDYVCDRKFSDIQLLNY